MKIINVLSRWITACGCGIILLGASQLTAQDWPEWRGQNRQGKAIGFKAPEQWPATLNKQWSTQVGTGDATPALVGDKLYVFARQGADEVLLCLNANDGKEIWQKKYAAQAVTGAAGRHPGPRSSPTVAEGKVVTLGVGGVVTCFDAATGEQLWQKDEFPKVFPQFFTSMSPLVVDGKCIAHLGGQKQAAVIAFDLASGEPKWKWTGDSPAYGSPILFRLEGIKQVVVQGEKNLTGIAVADGNQLWQIPTPIKKGSRVWNSATPIVEGQTIYFTGQGSGTRAVKIEKKDGEFAIQELWTNDIVGTGYNTPVLKDNMLFGLSDGGKLFCLNAQTGETAWVDTTSRKQSFGALVDAGSAIMALPSNGELIVFKPSATQFEELAKYKVADTEVYAHPVATGNRIYIKDNETVTLWTL